VLDGELFVAIGDRLEFETLQERIHPAKSRVDMLAEKTPAGFVAFDLLALGDESYVDRPLRERARRWRRRSRGSAPAGPAT
jgi:ATP-dependent DNA ligase